jgi:hypothetical protein
VVTGYRGSANILQAIEQGEVAGIVTNLATFARRPDLMDRTVVRLFQMMHEVPDLPVLDDLVSPRLLPVLRMINAPSAAGMPFVAPPEVPSERLAILRRAFSDMARDASFIEDANRIGEPASAPIDGAALHGHYAQIISGATDATILAYKELTGQK